MEPVKNLLRPEQIRDTQDEANRLENMLGDPRAVLEDPKMAAKQLHNMKKILHEETPQAYSECEIDTASKREKDLRVMMVEDGMPTQAEMRKCPPGAVEKLRGWEARNKIRLQEWKYIRQRMHAGSTNPDIANFEKYRPAGGASELSMDNAVIEGKRYMLPPADADPVVVMSEEEHDVLKELDPEVAEMMVMATNTQRGQILSYVRAVMVDEKPVEMKEPEPKAKPKPKAKRKGRKMSEEERKAFGVKMAKAREKKKAEREAAENAS